MCHLERLPLTYRGRLSLPSAFLSSCDSFAQYRDKRSPNVLSYIRVRQSVDKSLITEIAMIPEENVLQKSLKQWGEHRMQASDTTHAFQLFSVICHRAKSALQ